MDNPTLFAVYGTLRTTCGNDRLWHGKAESIGLGKVSGFDLVARGAAFPYALPAHPSHQITVEVLEPHWACVESLTARMDQLEGTPWHYERWPVTVEMSTGDRTAWMYVASPSTAEHLLMAELPTIPSGDWITHLMNLNERI